jgi:hypothetical protein
MKTTGLILLTCACLFTTTAQANEAKAVIDKVKERASPPHERVQLKLMLETADGLKKERVLTILRKNEEGSSRALIRLLQPADIKGLSLLSVTEGPDDEQWLYTPSTKQSRRLVGANRKGKFLDSDITYEDLRADTYSEFNNKILSETGNTIEMESMARQDIESSYGKIHTWISKPEFRVEKVEYYDTKEKLLKRAEFKDYKKIDGKYWRAQLVLVQNLQEKTKTKLIVQKISVKKIADSEVSLAAMEE